MLTIYLVEYFIIYWFLQSGKITYNVGYLFLLLLMLISELKKSKNRII